jgi:hypothetical protein
LLVSGLCTVLIADEPTIKSAKPQEGVFFSYTGYTATVLELKDGHFRYWWESTEMKMPKEPVYPVTGDYSTLGDTITLERDGIGNLQSHWTFRSLDGAVTLWRRDAMGSFKIDKYLNMIKKYGGDSLLVKTDKPANDVWKHRGAPSF